MQKNEGQTGRTLTDHWSFAACGQRSVDLDDLDSLDWLTARVPGTVAGNLSRHGLWKVGDADDLDAREYWFRCLFDANPADDRLELDGLATLADVWLNGRHVLTSDNMFMSHVVPVSEVIRAGSGNELLIRFSSLTDALNKPRPRARWRTRLAGHRNLRFFRTLLLGRTPGICLPVAPVGPWRPVRLRASETLTLQTSDIRPRTADHKGVVDLNLRLVSSGPMVESACAVLADARHDLAVRDIGGEIELSGQVVIHSVEHWWPHTHGIPKRYPLSIVLTLRGGSTRQFDFAPLGFRSLELRDEPTNLSITVNGQPIHCRGGCWMPLDLVTLQATREALRSELELLRDAGMNMVRLSGITQYESDDFYDLCDELGLMVWQDFPFANFDYPTDEPDFLASIEREVRHFLARIAHRPCLTVACGGSEILQQAAMLGLPCSVGENPWFDEALPALVHQARPDVVHVTHSPSGGPLPFYADQGVSHYFAVGGYRRPLAFAALEPPRFASECLAFAIPPGPMLVSTVFEKNGEIDLPLLESRAPRDNGSSWHFGEITDHYVREIFGVDVQALKTAEPRLYVSAAAIAVGETMRQTTEVWRANDVTRGALIWTLRDVWPGSGWGILDSAGEAKAPYYFLKRAWQPTALTFHDRGTNGLRLKMFNDCQQQLAGRLIVCLCRKNGQALHQTALDIEVGARASQEWSVDEMLGGFVDSSYAYQFGPPAFDVAIARFVSDDLAEPVVAYHTFEHAGVDLGQSPPDPKLSWVLERQTDTTIEIRVRCESYVQYVILEFPGCRLSDNYFSLLPGDGKVVQVSAVAHSDLIGTLGGFNCSVRVPINLRESTGAGA